MSKKLSLIIVTYNSLGLIFDCLESVFMFNDIDQALEVIVVDNCSADQDEVFVTVKQMYGDQVKLVASPANGGYGYGNNRGIELAASPVVVVMNPDVRLVTPVFQSLLRHFDNSITGLVGVRFTDGSSTYYYKPEYVNFIKLMFQKVLLKWGFFKANEVYFSGSFLTFNKSDFEAAGSFDERIFLYFEEPDITNRIQALGKEVILDSNIAVLHLAHGREVNLSVIDEHLRTLKYYQTKYPFNIKGYIRTHICVNTIKQAVAAILGNQRKKREFQAWKKKYMQALEEV
jgi:GT2 family glycosyltransferase